MTIARGARRSCVAMLAAGLALSPSTGMPASPAAPAVSSGDRVHVIRSGDTLSGIAKQYDVTVAAIVRANGLANDAVRLRLGVRLVIPPASPSAVRDPSPARSPQVAGARADRSGDAARTRTRPSATPASLRLSIPDFVDAMPPFVWPVEGSVSSNFGRRRRGWHKGIDIVAPPGARIVATAAGFVIASAVERRYGRVVKIAHEGNFISVYAHNTQNLVDLGEWVAAGQVIATVGRTGRATAEHLHFEIRHDGFAYNPLYLLPLPPRMVQVEEMELDEDDEHD